VNTRLQDGRDEPARDQAQAAMARTCQTRINCLVESLLARQFPVLISAR